MADSRLDGSVEDQLGMLQQVGIERILPGEQHHQGLPPRATGPARLLPERRQLPREPGHEHRVDARDVNAELQRVRGGQPKELPGLQCRLQVAAFHRQVAAPVGRDPGGIGGEFCRGQADELRTGPGCDEGQRLGSIAGQARE